MTNLAPHLAWFLGPKGELGHDFEAALVDVVRDYVHWRRNYFPADQQLLTPSRIRELSNEQDAQALVLSELSARLRRDFPFYSPRYLAHQLSDVLTPATIGYVAALLHNANNVTPEAAPVTVDLEIEATNTLLEMVGYQPSPELPTVLADLGRYEREVRRTFGWAHLCSGGTAANIEALWAARLVRYFPFAAREAAIEHHLRVPVRFPAEHRASGPETVDIRDLGAGDLLALRTNESIFLMERFVAAVQVGDPALTHRDARLRALAMLSDAPSSLSRPTSAVFGAHPPCILVPRTAHYSLTKAADLVGIGRDQLVPVEVDARFRMRIDHLEELVDTRTAAGEAIVAVVGVAGTTEEGSVDPIHHIAEFRRSRERARTQTFWFHVDAAWTGYLRSLFDRSSLGVAGYCRDLGVAVDLTLQGTHERVADAVRSAAAGRDIDPSLDGLNAAVAADDLHQYQRSLAAVVHHLRSKGIDLLGTAGGESTSREISTFVRDTIQVGFDRPLRTRGIGWGEDAVLEAFDAIGESDSLTTDPHKMGYLPYPSGVVAFRNDRIRHFMHTRAQYITDDRGAVQEHQPMRRVHDLVEARRARDAGAMGPHPSLRAEVHAAAPYTLEGSRPGAAAAALWTSFRVVRPDWFGYGGLVRSSLLAARAFSEWLTSWPLLLDDLGAAGAYRLVNLTDGPPDTNIVNFVACPGSEASIEAINNMTGALYDHFSIDSEGGADAHSYSQPYFLSRTRLDHEQYPQSVLASFLARAGVERPDEYEHTSIMILRATLMSPYIDPLRTTGAQDVLRDFFADLHAYAMAYLATEGAESAR